MEILALTSSTLKDSDQESLPCLVKEIDLSKLAKREVIGLCLEVVSPTFQTGSSNLVEVLHVGASEPDQLGTRLHIVTELFTDSVRDLVSVSSLI